MRLFTFLLTLLFVAVAETSAKPDPIFYFPKEKPASPTKLKTAVWLQGYRGWPGAIEQRHFQATANKLKIAMPSPPRPNSATTPSNGRKNPPPTTPIFRKNSTISHARNRSISAASHSSAFPKAVSPPETSAPATQTPTPVPSSCPREE